MQPAAQAIATRFRHGHAHFEAGRLREAEAALREVLMLAPWHVDAIHLLGIMAHRAGHHDGAAGLFTQAIKLAPSQAELHWNLGSVQREMGRPEEALASFRKALRLKPNSADMHRKLGDVLVGLGQLDEAIKRYQRAIQLRPSDSEAHHNLARVNKSLGRIEAALAGFRESVRLTPEHPQSHYNLSVTLLLAGELQEGWDEYEWRWCMPMFTRRDCAQPVWDGAPLQGATLLVHAEQGFGDTFQFCRFIPLLARNNSVVLQAPRPALRLLGTLEYAPSLIAPDEAAPHFDAYCSLMSLPALLGTTLENLPSATPYLHAEPKAAAAWVERLAPHAGLRVGIAWAGSPACVADGQRSVTLQQLRPLTSVPGVTFVSLQKDADGAPGMLDWTGELHDFADTAALIDGLDLVVSVDTVVAHLAGALGKPVWLLNRFDPCWRWLLGRDDSPWYPTLRQFRQSQAGRWDDVIDRVAVELARLAPSARS